MRALPPPHAIYLHIPFCATKCSYCAFNTYERLEDLIEPFVGALCAEIEISGKSHPALPVTTVFFGGGTPSLLTPQQFERILAALWRSFAIEAGAEITIESNPNDLHLDYLLALRSLGINRISIGMQSATMRDLRLFKRRHDVQMVIDAVEAARRAGFDNLNLDLIYGNPDQSLQEWQDTLETALNLQPDHLSLYALELKGGTPLRADVGAGRVSCPDDDLAADMYDLASERLEQGGFAQYEISNWSKPGAECRHNLQYWRSLPFLGFGPGAHGYAEEIRYSNIVLPQRYIRAIQHSEGTYTLPYTPAVAKSSRLDTATQRSQTLMMGLRLTQEGIHRKTFQARFGIDIAEAHAAAITKFVDLGLLCLDEECLLVTKKGRLLLNSILCEMI